MDVIRVDRGSRVHKGELIIQLSAPELVAQRAQATSALRAAESQLTTAKAKVNSDKRYLPTNGFSRQDAWGCRGK
jgi:multidrug efflux pump subunit AcrA (membrane-fusion protein)